MYGLATAAFEQQQIAPISGHLSPEYLRRTQRQCPEPEWPINLPVSQTTWLPEAVVTFTGKRPPSRDGALVFTYAPIPVPGVTCPTALELALEEWFEFPPLSTTVAQWVFWPIPLGALHTYHLDYEVVPGTGEILTEIRIGPCPGSIVATLSMSDESVPIATVGGFDLLLDSFLLSSGTATIRVRLRF